MSDNIRVVAIAFFRQTDQKYLICRRGPAGSGAGAWEFPGGKVDAGETEVEALVREVSDLFIDRECTSAKPVVLIKSNLRYGLRGK